MDDCAPIGGKREITARRRRRRRGERGCTTMISFFHVFWGKFANEFCCCVYQVWFWIFLPHKSIFACALLQRCLFVMVFCSSNGIWKCICAIIISPSSLVDINNKWFVTMWPCHLH